MPRLLDLYCGAGGAARGYQLAGFEVWGVDSEPQPHYVGERFQQMDAFKYVERYGVDNFDAIHASPPCQAYTTLRHPHSDRTYADLLASTRDLLKETGLPWVIENVPGSPTQHLVVLCGSMFGLGAMSGDGWRVPIQYRQLRRHRNFEASFDFMSPPCMHSGGESLGVYGHGPVRRYNGRDQGRRGGYQGTADERRTAMGIDWMNRDELSQAIPPAYTEYIGGLLLAEL